MVLTQYYTITLTYAKDLIQIIFTNVLKHYNNVKIFKPTSVYITMLLLMTAIYFYIELKYLNFNIPQKLDL